MGKGQDPSPDSTPVPQGAKTQPFQSSVTSESGAAGIDGSGLNHSGHAHPAQDHPDHNHADAQSHTGHNHGLLGGHAGHSHAPANYNRAFAIGVTLNMVFVLVEAGFGLISGSMALVADAGHNLSDVLALLIAWGASALAAKPASRRYTYGYKSSTMLAALTNAVLLLIAIGAIFYESLRRLVEPAPVEGWTMIWVAGVGVLINAGTAMLFMKGRENDINIRGAYLHLAADALVSVGVVVAGAAILLTGAAWLDPVTSIIIVAVIAWGTWGLLRDSVKMSLLAVPDNIDGDAVHGYLSALPGVSAVHDLHIWPMSTTETALTAHLEMPGGHPGDGFLQEAVQVLATQHSIKHVTLQIDQSRDCGSHC